MVTVVIPAWNDGPGLDRCLAALARQSFDRSAFDVVVCDNGSSPPLSPQIPPGLRAQVVREPRPGSYAARNRALQEATGLVLAFTDADCLPEPGWLAAGVARARDPSGPGVVGGPVEVFPEPGRRPTWAERYDMAAAFPVRRFVEREGFAVTANLFVRRDVMEKAGPFDASLKSGGDREWCRRAARAGHPVVFEPAAVVRHPARTLGPLLRKYRRVIGGRTTLARGGLASGLDAADLGRQAGPGTRRASRGRALARQMWPIARYREIRADAALEGKPVDARTFAVVLAIQWTMLAESLRLRLGGKALR